MKLAAFAKINLSLGVFEKRPDGFHNIESVMQSVSLHDIITLTPVSSGIEVTCNDPDVPLGKQNLAYKVAKLFFSHESRVSSQGVKIHIQKNIPIAAGLAGGSADAAAVLFGLNEMMTGDPSTSLGASPRLATRDLIELGSRIGSDVPFCLTGGTCLVKGRGEIVEKQLPWPKTYYVLVCPDIHVSTKWAYEEFDRLHLNVSSMIKNDLEQAVVSKHEVISDIKDKLIKAGCSEAQMSGSGPSVFGIVKHKVEAEVVFSKIKEDYPRSFLVETVNNGIKII